MTKVIGSFLLIPFVAFSLSGRTLTDLSGEGWTCDGEAVSVPHTWNATDACDGPGATRTDWTGHRGGDSVGGTGYLKKRAVYRRSLPAKRKGRRFFLRFEGASVIAEVKINGCPVGTHVGAFTGFTFEVTDFLRMDGESELEVAVDNRWNENTQPMSADYSVYGGLYRKVWLLETDLVCIDPVTDGADGVKVAADPKTGEVTVEVAVLGGTNEMQRFRIEDPELWSPENPKLYARRIEISQGGSVDAVDVRFGFRTFEFRDGFFYLNGKRRQLRGVNRHQDRAGKGWAVSPTDEEEDIRLIKEMGADALRTAHYPQSRHIYDLCDEQGIVCWVEYPNVNRLTLNETFETGMHRQVREMVAQIRNHPSVAVWSIFNELYNSERWMRDRQGEVETMMARTRDLIHRLDPSRTVVGVMDEKGIPTLNVIPDEYGLNVYPGWYSSLNMREMLDWVMCESGRKTVAISEYGVGASVFQHGDPSHCVNAGGDFHSEEYQAFRMHDNLLQMMCDDRVWGSYVWTMFDFGADNRHEGDRYGINDKGLVTHDRKTRKDCYYMYQAVWTKTPVLHLVGSRMTSLTNDVVTVMGFSNIGPVTLSIDGREIGERTPDEACGVLWPDIRLHDGINCIELKAKGVSVEAQWNLTRVKENVRKQWSVRDFGAKGDGIASDTEAVQKAIDTAFAAGGGRVVVPDGIYCCGSLRLRSRVELHLQKGAVIEGGVKSESYFSFPKEVCADRPEKSDKVFLYGWDETDVAITGDGTIEGRGPEFFDRSKIRYGRFWDKPDFPRPRMLQLVKCRNVRFEGVSFHNSPNWTMLIRRCENIGVNRIRVVADRRIINSDGIDFDGCRRVCVRNSFFSTGDDCIIMRAIREPGSDEQVVCEDVEVSDCTLMSACQSVRIGCPSDDTIRHVRFKNIKAGGYNGILFEYPSAYLQKRDDGFMDVSDVVFDGFTGDFGCRAIQIVIGPGIKIRGVRNVLFRDFDVKTAFPIRFIGNVFSKIEDVRFENVSVNGERQQDGPVSADCTNAEPLKRKKTYYDD